MDALRVASKGTQMASKWVVTRVEMTAGLMALGLDDSRAAARVDQLEFEMAGKWEDSSVGQSVVETVPQMAACWAGWWVEQMADL
jgi:hypothetical protein